MPHVIVKLYPGRSEQAKQALTREITRAVVAETGCKESSVSVALEEVAPEDWADAVYQRDILDGPGVIYKAPGYTPFDAETSPAAAEKGLTDAVRDGAQAAAMEDASGEFNPMAWLDLELEDNPGRFDPFFAAPWHELTDTEKQERMKAVRAVL